jgi:hypothetical protein
MGSPQDTFPGADADEVSRLLAHHALPIDGLTLPQNLLIVDTCDHLVLGR